MTRKDYIAGLEEIRKQVKQIGAAFRAVDLTDATGMESDRRKKTTKLVADLCDRLYEDIAISAKVAADKAEEGSGEQGDLFEEAEKAQAGAEQTARADAAATATEAEVVEVKLLEAPKPEAEKPADDEKPTKKSGKGKKPGKKGGAK